MFKGIVIGVLAAALAGLIGAYLFVVLGLMPANADGRPPALERWAAHKSLHATLRREAPKGEGPLKADDKTLTAGAAIYKENCLVCHGSADGKASNIAKGLYQHPPQFASHGVDDDPVGVTYWKVEHGIRLTGMPAFSPTLSDNEVWQVSLFLKHLPKLPAKAEAAWKAMPGSATVR